MKFMIFDTETTDLVGNSLLPLKNQPHIIEFYACLVNDEGKVERELDFLCNPGIKLEPIITKITGLTDNDLKDAHPFKQYVGVVEDMIRDADAVVAHNLSFDMAVVEAEFARCSRKPIWPKSQICTVEATEWVKGFRMSLSLLHEHLFGEPFTGAHRARVDVAALTRCFIKLREEGMV